MNSKPYNDWLILLNILWLSLAIVVFVTLSLKYPLDANEKIITKGSYLIAAYCAIGGLLTVCVLTAAKLIKERKETGPAEC